ncbi:hypothetical protein IFM89_023672, partial [Coptis chinensis]
CEFALPNPILKSRWDDIVMMCQLLCIDRRAGVIVNASETKAEKKPTSVNINGIPTRVLLLRNMPPFELLIPTILLSKGGSREVNDELEDEVASESVKSMFERSKETTNALIDLDGRFFGGRTVHTRRFDDEERFGKNELAPCAGEVPGTLEIQSRKSIIL